MKSQTAAWVATVVGTGLIAFILCGQMVRATQPQNGGGSYQELRDRIGKLETEIATLRTRLRDLESKRFLTIPRSQLPGGSEVPKGSKQFEFNGQKFWYVPVSLEQAVPGKK